MSGITGTNRLPTNRFFVHQDLIMCGTSIVVGGAGLAFSLFTDDTDLKKVSYAIAGLFGLNACKQAYNAVKFYSKRQFLAAPPARLDVKEDDTLNATIQVVKRKIPSQGGPVNSSIYDTLFGTDLDAYFKHALAKGTCLGQARILTELVQAKPNAECSELITSLEQRKGQVFETQMLHWVESRFVAVELNPQFKEQMVKYNEVNDVASNPIFRGLMSSQNNGTRYNLTQLRSQTEALVNLNLNGMISTVKSLQGHSTFFHSSPFLITDSDNYRRELEKIIQAQATHNLWFLKNASPITHISAYSKIETAPNVNIGEKTSAMPEKKPAQKLDIPNTADSLESTCCGSINIVTDTLINNWWVGHAIFFQCNQGHYRFYDPISPAEGFYEYSDKDSFLKALQSQLIEYLGTHAKVQFSVPLNTTRYPQ